MSSSEYVGMSVRKSHYVIVRIHGHVSSKQVRIRGHVSSKEVRIRGHITVTAHLYYVIVRIRGHVSKEVRIRGHITGSGHLSCMDTPRCFSCLDTL